MNWFTDESIIANAKRTAAAALAVLSGLFLMNALTSTFITAVLDLQIPEWIPDVLHERIYNWVLEHAGFAVGPQRLLGVIANLYKTDTFLGVVVFVFSIVIPFGKVVVCLLGAIYPTKKNLGPRLAAYISKYAMADVFIVSLVVVLIKADQLVYRFRIEEGFWFFFAAVIASWVSALLLTIGNSNEGTHPR